MVRRGGVSQDLWWLLGHDAKYCSLLEGGIKWETDMDIHGTHTYTQKIVGTGIRDQIINGKADLANSSDQIIVRIILFTISSS